MSVAYYETGHSLYLAGNYQDAIAPLEKAVEFNPENGDPYYDLGRCYDNVGRGEEAKREHIRPDMFSLPW